MINLFIPSKDRACQLNLLLESLNKNAKNLFSPHIMWTSSNNDFRTGYEKLINSNQYNNIVWNEEYNPQEQFMDFLNYNKNIKKNIGLFTDDSILYRKTSFTENLINDFLSKEEIWSVHARIGKNITITDYVTNKKINYPNTLEILTELIDEPHCILPRVREYLKWNYREVNHPRPHDSYWFFSSPFDGSFYRPDDLLFLLGNSKFESIILYEHQICNNGNQEKTSRDHLVAPSLSECVTIQWNSSHNYGFRTSGAVNHSLKSLNDRFLDGYSVDIESMDFSSVNCCHQEIPFEWKKDNE